MADGGPSQYGKAPSRQCLSVQRRETDPTPRMQETPQAMLCGDRDAHVRVHGVEGACWEFTI
eukprot:8318278-Alexandrium_andersonii.AAC.1